MARHVSEYGREIVKTIRKANFDGPIHLSLVLDDDLPAHCYRCRSTSLGEGDLAQFRGDHWLCEYCSRP
ncbi:hypothetical protein [Mycolicibacillus koreensis]|nr:hypothetical protein [Mycolicibacillus koreensis]